MIFTIISYGLLLAVAPIFHFIYKKTYKDWAATIAVLSFVIGLIGFFTCNLLMIGVGASKDIEYEKVTYEREVLEYRLEHKDEFENGNEFLYSEITEFNNELRSTKKWAANPWVNLFFNDKIATIDYIELE